MYIYINGCFEFQKEGAPDSPDRFGGGPRDNSRICERIGGLTGVHL